MRVVYLLLCLLFSQITWANDSDLMLLGTYENQDIQGWVMSEKLDGVRGYWDGKTLLSRQRLPLPAPTYFTAQFPPLPLMVSYLVNVINLKKLLLSRNPLKDDNWTKLILYVFDVPNASGNLFERLKTLEDYLKEHPTPYIKIIPQIPIRDKTHLFEYLHEIEGKKVKGLYYVILMRLTKENAVHKF